MKGYKIPKYGRNSKGLPIVNLLNLVEGEELAAVMTLKDFESGYLFFTTTKGIVKRTKVSDFQNIRVNGIKAITLRDYDYLHSVKLTDGTRDIIIGASNGKAIRFKENDVRSMGRSAAGVKGIDLSGEEEVIVSLISCLIPPGILHVNAVQSVAFKHPEDTLNFLAFSNSLIADAYYKATARDHFQPQDCKRMPFIDQYDTAKSLALRLNCVSEYYADFWNQTIQTLDKNLSEAFNNSSTSFFEKGIWNENVWIKTELNRRYALVQLDVLVSMKFRLKLGQLIDLYRIYFPVLQENEADTWYDQNGRIVWTRSKGLPGVGYLNEKGKSPGRKEWESILESNPSELLCTAIDDTIPDGPDLSPKN